MHWFQKCNFWKHSLGPFRGRRGRRGQTTSKSKTMKIDVANSYSESERKTCSVVHWKGKAYPFQTFHNFFCNSIQLDHTVKIILDSHCIKLYIGLKVMDWFFMQFLRQLGLCFRAIELLRPHKKWVALIYKVHIFWEGHKILQNLPLIFDCMYCGQK